MEPRDRDSGEGEKPRGPQAPQVVGTNDPDIIPGAASNPDWIHDPDQTMAIETSRIRGPDEAFHPNFVLVPVEVERRDEGGNGKKAEKGQDRQGGEGHKDQGASVKKGGADSEGDGNKDQAKSGGKPGDEKHGKSSHAPSLARILVFSGIVALVCGVAGAWAYSSFFGSSKSGDQKSSGQGSESGKGSDSGKGSGSETSQNGEEQTKIREAESAWLMAVKELNAVKAEEQAAQRSEEEAKSILSFLKRSLLSAGRPIDAPLSEAFWAGGPAKDVSLRKAVDLTESQVAETFAERPLAEATVREMLGQAYLSLGDAAPAVKQYERAFALRQAMQGANAPETAACRNQLAVAYRLAGKTLEGSRLFDRNPDSPAYAATLAVSGTDLLARKNPAEAELKLRECLNIRERIQPYDWTTFETKSLLGEALLDQGRFSEAEPLLLAGYEGMKQHAGAIPHRDRPRLSQALERLVKLYESWGKKGEAARWRKELEASTR
jgi:tetratricopeptide (TPR) repeat protein